MSTRLLNDKQEKLLTRAKNLALSFRNRAEHSLKEGDWLEGNLEDLKNEGFLALTVPSEYGGEGINLVDYLLVQEALAEGDGATALSIGWHLGCILEEAEARSWNPHTFQRLCEDIVSSKSLLNLAATELATGSPSRGGMPMTTAEENSGGYVITGRKSFTSMAAVLDYSLVTAQIHNSGNKGLFLVDHSLPGVSIIETWDSIAMRGTKSDDLELNKVSLQHDSLLVTDDGHASPKAWYLQIPAVYIGIAKSARNYAVDFAASYQPSTLPGPIIDVPEVQRKIGEMELELYKSRELLYSAADKWVNFPELRGKMGPELAAVKHIATNSANKIVDHAMRIVGARSLSEKNPLQRYFRDVRAGLHNPPTDDAIVYMLAGAAIKEAKKKN
ncbi:acyl-CoA dehydrogenase family protein [Metabacillus lacus]|uniref:acyl-CoA dehydrogenase family protein n=1 Tax=Metabacillus lacus TaxID=1983721 RepID=UPI001FE5302A|nr:acyl-CoA dehydrogenase family protein [Metabacillus lacus]